MIHSELVEGEHHSVVKVQLEGSNSALMKEFSAIIEALLHHSDLKLLTLECMVHVAEQAMDDSND